MAAQVSKCSWPPPQLPLKNLTVHAENAKSPTSYALLLHGLTGTPLEMLPLAKSLAQRGVESSIPLLPGHGTTLDDLSSTRIEEWVFSAERSLLSLNSISEGKEVLVCGLSFGALLALRLMRSHPGLIAMAVLLSPPIALRSKTNEFLLGLLSIVPEPLLALLGTKAKKSREENYLSQMHYAYPRHSLAATIRLTKLRGEILRAPPAWEKPLLLGIDPLDHLVDSPEVTRWFLKSYPRGRTCELLKGEHELTLGYRSEELFGRIGELLKRSELPPF